MSASGRILLGHIGRAHGLKGEVVLASYASPPGNIAAYGPLDDEAGRSRITIESVREGPQGLIARLAGVRDRTAAEALRGTALYVDRDRLPPATDGEYYHSDLVGLSAVDEAGTVVGTVVGMHNFGAGDLVEIRCPERRETELVAFTDEFVPTVDIASGRMVVRLPATDDEPSDAPG